MDLSKKFRNLSFRFSVRNSSLKYADETRQRDNLPAATSEPELASGTSSTGDLSSTNHRNKSTNNYPGATSTLPTEKRASGLKKRLQFNLKKKITSGSATVPKLSTEHRYGSGNLQQLNSGINGSPVQHSHRDGSSTAKNSKKTKSSGRNRSLVQDSPVKSLVSEHHEDEDLPASLPPPMQIVGQNLDSNDVSRSSACSVASDSSSSVVSCEEASQPAKIDHSISADLRNEMEDILRKKLPKTPTRIKNDDVNNEWMTKVANQAASSTSSSSYVKQKSSDGAPNAEDAPVADSVQPVPDEKSTVSEVDALLQRRHYVLMELVQTEREYVSNLATITEGYMTKLLEKGLPQDPGKERVVFGNIAQIYEWHRDTFQKEIEKCLEQPELLGGLFVRYERRLHMYVKYCQNKPLSEYLVHKYKTTLFSDIQSELKTKLDIGDYLIKPVQRIMKYQLLLKDFLKFTERAKLNCDDLKAAVQVMHVVPKLANDMMMVARMSEYPGRLSAQGKLLLQDTFLVTQGSSGSEKERKVFFFEQSVIFAELVDKKNEERGFLFKSSIKNSDLSLKDVPSSTTRFCLVKRASNETMELCTNSPQIKNIWIEKIKQQLDNQMDFLNALQDPLARQRQQYGSTSSANSNNNNSNAKRKDLSPKPFLSSFRPNQHNNIHLNCKPGGEISTKISSQEVASSVTSLSSCPASEGNADSTCSPPRSKQPNKKAPPNIEISRPRTPPFPVAAVDQTDPIFGRANERLALPATTSKSPAPMSTADSVAYSDNHVASERLKSLQLRLSSTSETTGRDLGGRIRSQSSLRSPLTIRQTGNHCHKSAPDLSGSNSFWLSPLSPANIKSSTCKFVYPNENEKVIGASSLSGAANPDSTTARSGRSNRGLFKIDARSFPVKTFSSNGSCEEKCGKLRASILKSRRFDRPDLAGAEPEFAAPEIEDAPPTRSDRISVASSQAFSTLRSNITSASTSSEKIIVTAIEDYKALKEDEISVKTGDNLDVIATNAQGLCLVYRAATKSTPAAEGWIPGHVIGHATATNQAKKGRITPRAVKRNNNAKKPQSSSSGPLSRMLRRSKSSDKLSDKTEQFNTYPHRHGSSNHSVDLVAT